MKDMIPLRCATHPHRKSAEYGSHVISNAKSTLYQGLRSGRRSSPGTAPMSCRRCSPASFGEPFVPASRPPNWSWQTRYARHFPNFSWLPQKAILSPNSSLSGRTQKICGLSAWLREQKDGLLSIVQYQNKIGDLEGQRRRVLSNRDAEYDTARKQTDERKDALRAHL